MIEPIGESDHESDDIRHLPLDVSNEFVAWPGEVNNDYHGGNLLEEMSLVQREDFLQSLQLQMFGDNQQSIPVLDSNEVEKELEGCPSGVANEAQAGTSADAPHAETAQHFDVQESEGSEADQLEWQTEGQDLENSDQSWMSQPSTSSSPSSSGSMTPNGKARGKPGRKPLNLPEEEKRSRRQQQNRESKARERANKRAQRLKTAKISMLASDRDQAVVVLQAYLDGTEKSPEKTPSSHRTTEKIPT